MSDVVPEAFGQELVGTSPTLIFTVPPTAESATVRLITGANVATSSRVLTVWKIPASGSPEDKRVIIPGLTIPGKGVLSDDGVHVIMVGGSLVAQANLPGITLTASGAFTVPDTP